MMVPMVHLNGTSKDELVRLNVNAGCAVLTAIAALGEACPNGRDFYKLGPDAMTRAVAEHDARVAKLREVHAELTALVDALDQGR